MPLHPTAAIFDDATRWLPVASGEAELKLAADRGALRMDFDFKGGKGFVVARREVKLDLPPEFVLRFKARGRAPVNHFELKLADESGRNVWRREFKDFRLSPRAREIRVADHEIEFAWGPAGGGAAGKVGALEFAVVAGEGGAGCVWLSGWEIEDRTLKQPPSVRWSSAQAVPTVDVSGVFDWWAGAAAGSDGSDLSDASYLAAGAHWLHIDFRAARLLGGLIIEWEQAAPSSGFRIRGSNSGRTWKTLHQTKRAGGARSYVFLPNTTTRLLLIELHECVGVRAVRWQRFDFSSSIEAFWHHIAANEPRGWHPRWLMREQSLWTPAGIPNGRSCALINEEGTVEIDEGSFSVEPFVEVDGRLFTWADVNVRQALRDGWRPAPSVIWTTEKWTMQIETLPRADGGIRVRHRFMNRTSGELRVRLLMAIRPFQVTPPWQHFRNVGGVSRIHDLRWQGGGARVNGSISLFPDDDGAVSFGAQSFDEGVLVERLAADAWPEHAQVHDDFGFASGVIAFSFALAADGEAEKGWSTSRGPDSADPWHDKLPEEQIQCSGWGAEAARTALTATAHILITRSGPALQPGPRRYTRSWIRDGTIMSAALLRMGCAEEVRDFLRWYAGFVRGDGFVPCCVDRDGPDWLVEHDSHGQFLALIADYVRFTNDTALLTELWPRVVKTADFIGRIIEPAGLLPISASHEGYLAQPVHSYWDDFWAVRGLRDAADVAGRLHHRAEAVRWRDAAEKLRAALLASIETTCASKQLDYIPGSLEWADFDPTATANAIGLLDMGDGLNREVLMRTFDRYLTDWRKKRRGEMEWSNYSPYEIRIIGALVRLGRRDDALELLRFFLSDRRPLAWNQWPEIAWHDPRSPGHIGDVPHTWIGAEYVLAVRSLFAFESESRKAMVIAAGIAAEWMDGEGVRVKELPTSRGPLSYSLRRLAGGTIVCDIAAGLDLPEGGLILRPPIAGGIWRATLDDEVIEARGAEEIRIDVLPATVAIHPSSHA